MSGEANHDAVSADFGAYEVETISASIQLPSEIRIAKGAPTVDELAALVAVFAAAAPSRSFREREAPPRDEWGKPADHYQIRPFFGPGSYFQY